MHLEGATFTTQHNPSGGHLRFCDLGISGRAKGAARGSCGETVVQKGVFGESVSSLLP